MLHSAILGLTPRNATQMQNAQNNAFNAYDYGWQTLLP